jgi:uncharacterized protein (DUF2249 family)
MIINANTKIAHILKQDANALEAIISISHTFEKLRNPVLRKILAGRTSLTMASRLGNCNLEDFYQKLEPLGFKIDRSAMPVQIVKPVPHFVKLPEAELIPLDVRPVIAAGNDPLNMIMDKIKMVAPGQALKIINTFEPTPLMALLEKKGFETYTVTISHNHFETYFFRPGKKTIEAVPVPASTDWEHLMQRFAGHLQEADVRHLAMPQPMLTILAALDHLPGTDALYVLHKRIPVFLLPELAERKFEYRIKEISSGEVHLLIFRN